VLLRVLVIPAGVVEEPLAQALALAMAHSKQAHNQIPVAMRTEEPTCGTLARTLLKLLDNEPEAENNEVYFEHALSIRPRPNRPLATV